MKKSTTNKALLMEMLSQEFKKEGGLGVKELDTALRGGSLQEKRQKLQLFVDVIVNDTSKWEKLQETIHEIREERLKEYENNKPG